MPQDMDEIPEDHEHAPQKGVRGPIAEDEDMPHHEDGEAVAVQDEMAAKERAEDERTTPE